MAVDSFSLYSRSFYMSYYGRTNIFIYFQIDRLTSKKKLKPPKVQKKPPNGAERNISGPVPTLGQPEFQVNAALEAEIAALRSLSSEEFEKKFDKMLVSFLHG